MRWLMTVVVVGTFVIGCSERGAVGAVDPQDATMRDSASETTNDAGRDSGPDAHTPTAEICDGIDNDLDGEVDEDFDLSRDPLNCGACGITCPSPDPSCVDGTCCDPGGSWGPPCYNCFETNNGVEICDGIDNDCDGQADEDFDLATDPNNCGGCNAVCVVLNATPTCQGGTCSVGNCNLPFEDCNGLAIDGCEADLTSDPLNCSGCGIVCIGPDGLGTCAVGQCNPTCDWPPGWSDCDGDLLNGCEIDTTSDPNNCGLCGFVCPVGQTCQSSSCQ